MIYPASGWRNSNSGGVVNLGVHGSSWSSSPNTASGLGGAYLDFISSSMFPESSYHRAYGFPVRCVQFRNRRAQRPLADFAEPPRNGAPAGGVNVIKGVERRTKTR